jgi:hypothetical protein
MMSPLLFPDDTTQTFAVRKDVDMSKASISDDMVIHSTEAIAITVSKP